MFSNTSELFLWCKTHNCCLWVAGSVPFTAQASICCAWLGFLAAGGAGRPEEQLVASGFSILWPLWWAGSWSEDPSCSSPPAIIWAGAFHLYSNLAAAVTLSPESFYIFKHRLQGHTRWASLIRPAQTWSRAGANDVLFVFQASVIVDKMSSSDTVSCVIISSRWELNVNMSVLILMPSSLLPSWPLRASCRNSALSLWEWRQKPFWPWHLTGCCRLYPPWPDTHRASDPHRPMPSPPNYGYITHTQDHTHTHTRLKGAFSSALLF